MKTYESEFDALQQTVGFCGKEFKEVACAVFPDMKPASAYAKLKVCLDPTGDERLKFGQVIALAKFCNSYEALQYFCDETMHARPDRKAPEDDMVKLSETIQGAADVLAKATAALERLQGGPLAMRRVA